MRAGENRPPVLPLTGIAAEASLQGQVLMGQPDARRNDNPSLSVDPTLPTAAVVRTGNRAEMRSVDPTAATAVDGTTGLGAERRTDATMTIGEHCPSAYNVQATLDYRDAPSTQPTQQGEGLLPPLRQAVSQLAQQRTAVIQAVQARAQRAMQNIRGEDLPGEGDRESFASSQQGDSVQLHEESVPDRISSSWSVTRFNEVLYRYFVAPVIKHVYAGGKTGSFPGVALAGAPRSTNYGGPVVNDYGNATGYRGMDSTACNLYDSS